MWLQKWLICVCKKPLQLCLLDAIDQVQRGSGVTSAWRPLGILIEGQKHPVIETDIFLYIHYIHTVILFWVETVLVWCWSSSRLCIRWQLQWHQIKLNHNFTLPLRIWLALGRHWSYFQIIFTQKYIKHYLFLLLYICFETDTFLWLTIIIIFVIFLC